MEIINISFAILLVKLVICVFPGIVGAILLSADEETMRSFRSWICRRLFGVSNAFQYRKFARFMRAVGILLIAFSMILTWFVHLRGYFIE